MADISHRPSMRPRCPSCGLGRMRSRISLLPRLVDLRMCECVACGKEFKAPDPTDPVTSDVLGWLSGDLRAPT